MTHSSIDKKHIIVSGCSFTRWGGYNWPDYIDTDNITLYNVAHKGNCNEKVIRDAYQKFTNLSVKDNERAVVIIQLTGLERVMIDGVISPTIRSLYETKSKFNWLGKPNQESMGRFKHYFENVYTPELHLKKLFQDIITLQTILDEHSDRVDYRFFLGWDIFHVNENNMWAKNDKFVNNNTKLLIEEYPECEELWKKINFEKFWFFENDFVNYGGMMQWIQYNLESEDWYRDFESSDFHPTKSGHIQFTEKVIQPLVDEMFKNIEKKI